MPRAPSLHPKVNHAMPIESRLHEAARATWCTGSEVILLRCAACDDAPSRKSLATTFGQRDDESFARAARPPSEGSQCRPHATPRKRTTMKRPSSSILRTSRCRSPRGAKGWPLRPSWTNRGQRRYATPRRATHEPLPRMFSAIKEPGAQHNGHVIRPRSILRHAAPTLGRKHCNARPHLFDRSRHACP